MKLGWMSVTRGEVTSYEDALLLWFDMVYSPAVHEIKKSGAMERFFEREYVYPAVGPLGYYTYFWGNFVYWGAATLIYALFRLNGISF